MTVARAVLFLALGVLVGGVVAQILTGSAWYAIAWGAAALTALVLGIVVLVAALLRSGPTPPRRGPTWLIPVAAALVGLLVVLVPSAPALIAGPQSGGGAPIATSSDLRAGDGPQAAVAALIAATGQSKFTELGFLVSHATALAPTKPGATTLDVWDYRGGRAIRVGPEPADPDDKAELFDAASLDFGQVAAAVRKASAFTGMPVTPITNVVVQRTFAGGDGSGGLGPATIEVLFDDGHDDAHVSYDFDLTMVEKGGSLYGG